jgi:hypothetical protein
VPTHGSVHGCHGAVPIDFGCNQEIIHSQRDEPLLEFPNVHVFPPVPDPYVSLTPAELATFGIGPTRASDDDDDDVEEANDE